MLLKAGCHVRAFDPVAMDRARAILGDAVFFAPDMYAAAEGADALAVVTEWKQFRLPDWKRLHELMASPVLFDGRNVYREETLAQAGFTGPLTKIRNK